MPDPLHRGAVVWVNLDPTRDREQAGTRPAVVISSAGYLTNVPDLVIVGPVTSHDRGWPHHVPLAGVGLSLDRPSFAMTEQPHTIARARISCSADRLALTEVKVLVMARSDLTIAFDRDQAVLRALALELAAIARALSQTITDLAFSTYPDGWPACSSTWSVTPAVRRSH